MKKYLIPAALLIFSLPSFANNKDSVTYFQLPDSVKAISFLADISAGAINTKKEIFTGIKTDIVKLSLESDKKEKEIVFEFPSDAAIIARGVGINSSEKGELSWNYKWDANASYKLLISTAADSAGNFALYSGYIFLPKEKKWKLIGTCKISGQWNSLKQPAVFFTDIKKNSVQLNVNEAWCQRQNGSWKNMLQKNAATPLVNLLSHIDSLEQLQIDKQMIEKAISENKTDAKNIRDGIYYTLIKEGAGRQVSVNDTVVVFYKGYLFSDGSVFDETKDKPATFPLKRLIAGWQTGLSLCKVGSKIKLVIPSTLGYAIRTRAAKIPPNSILVFEVEVVDTRPSL